MMKFRATLLVTVLMAAILNCVLFAGRRPARAGDWPMWRYDAGRSAATPDALPDDLQLAWVRQLPPARPAWPAGQTKLQFDVAPEPIVMGQRIFVPSSGSDRLTAYDTRSGRELWRFYADGPLRFAPVGYQGKVYFVADDGHLYCLDAADGRLLWKRNGGPTERAVLGNGRLVSSWPARGGPVLADGNIYFAASIWPFMGIFIHAVDAGSGQIVWTNSGDGTNYTVQPHGAPSFATVVPQGHLVAAADRLIVPGGRSTPAVFDRATGQLEYFKYDKRNGGHDVAATADQFFVAGGGYSLATGDRSTGDRPVVFDDRFLIFAEGEKLRITSSRGHLETTRVKDRRGKEQTVQRWTYEPVAEVKLEGKTPERIFLLASDRLYGAGQDGAIVTIDLPEAVTKRAAKAKPLESVAPVAALPQGVSGTAFGMLAADDRLFVVTEEGRLACFAAGATNVSQHEEPKVALAETTDLWTEKVETLLDGNPAAGICLVLGLGTGRLVEELLAQSRFDIVVVDPDAEKVSAWRRRMDAAGLYGTRIAAHVGRPAEFPFPPYLATLIVSADLEAAGFAETEPFLTHVFQTLRPYGGTLALELSEAQSTALAAQVDTAEWAGATMKRRGDWTLLAREGALPESDQWTHQYGNPAQTVVSKDKRVKAPLGLLWFGGPSNDKILPRHGHGPSPQVAGGRLFIEGPDILRAVDVYTGRLLWEAELKDVGKYYDVTAHFAGAGEIGSNYVSLADAVYVVYGSEILELDAASGKVQKKFVLDSPADQPPPAWGTLAVEGDLLLATSSPVKVSTQASPPQEKPTLTKHLDQVRYASGSRRLVAMDRRSGKVLWTRDAEFNFRHNNIAIGAGKVFCIDSMSDAKLALLKRRGVAIQATPKFYALDARTGSVVWSTDQNVFGTFVNYSAEHDLVIQAGSGYRDRARDENAAGMIALRGADGRVVWHNKDLRYGGPCLLRRDRIITNGGGGYAIDITTGEPSGWSYARQYGCNTAIGSEHLLTFRSGAAGIFDLANDGGTGNLGGFRSSCTANLIAADGVLNAPDYTRTCSCAYQNQTSLALVHMPRAELWTFGATATPGQTGINFGAPGDRRAENGTLWVDYPSVGGSSPKVEVEVTGPRVSYYRHHASRITGDKLSWVVASGVRGAEQVRVDLKSTEADSKRLPPTYTVRLYFAEVAGRAPGERVFDVSLQGKPVLRNFDVAAEAGANRAVVREFRAVTIDGELVLGLAASENAKSGTEPILSGIEVLAEQKPQ